jgi:hypothetical protein
MSVYEAWLRQEHAYKYRFQTMNQPHRRHCDCRPSLRSVSDSHVSSDFAHPQANSHTRLGRLAQLPCHNTPPRILSDNPIITMPCMPCHPANTAPESAGLAVISHGDREHYISHSEWLCLRPSYTPLIPHIYNFLSIDSQWVL